MTPRQIANEMLRLKITMDAVAKRHGCYASVVSRALAGKGTSGPVLETAERMIEERKGRK